MNKMNQNRSEFETPNWILSQQKLTWRDLKDHLPGPTLAFLMHMCLIPLVVGWVVMSAPEPEKSIEIKSFTEVPVLPDPIPEQQLPPELSEIKTLDAADVTVERPSMDESSLEDIEIETPNIMIDDFQLPPLMKNFSPKKIPGLGPSSPFGKPRQFRTKNSDGSGSTLEGTFYDLKLNSNGISNGMTPENFAQIMKRFLSEKWNPKILNSYYQSPTLLYTSSVYIPRTSAAEAPKAYRCADNVKPSCWAAIYRGYVVAPKSGRFRFVGAGDDALVVRFGNQTVFDYGWYRLSLGKMISSEEWRKAMRGESSIYSDEHQKSGWGKESTYFYTYASIPHWNANLGGIATGRSFDVKAGEVYPIEILISEIPGGEFGAVLLIESLDESIVERDPTGSPILSLFRTNATLPEAAFRTKEAVPFAAHGPIWTVVPKNWKGNTGKVLIPEDDEALIAIE